MQNPSLVCGPRSEVWPCLHSALSWARMQQPAGSGRAARWAGALRPHPCPMYILRLSTLNTPCTHTCLDMCLCVFVCVRASGHLFATMRGRVTPPLLPQPPPPGRAQPRPARCSGAGGSGGGAGAHCCSLAPLRPRRRACCSSVREPQPSLVVCELAPLSPL